MALIRDTTRHLGTPAFAQQDHCLIAVQRWEQEADLFQDSNWIVAIHGYLARTDGVPGNSRRLSAAELANDFAQQGTAALRQLAGEYVLAIYNIAKQELWITNSLSMTRPLFYASQPGLTALGSELRQLWRTLDITPRVEATALVDLIISNGPSKDFEQTPFSGIQRILPPTVYRLTPARPQPHVVDQYWTPPEIDPSITVAEATDTVHSLLSDALQRATHGTRFGCSVSGGLDSSTLWAMLHRPGPAMANPGQTRAYTISFPGQNCDEAAMVERLMQHCNTVVQVIDGNPARESAYLDQHLAVIDTVAAMPTLFQTDLILQPMQAAGYHVHLSGLGAERAFNISRLMCANQLRAGHPLRAWQTCNHWKSYGQLTRPPGLHRFAAECLVPPGSRLRRWRPARSHPWLSQKYQTYYQQHQTLEQALQRRHGYHRGGMLYNNHHFALASQTEVLQQHSNTYQVDTRAPFLDQPIIDFAFRAPAEVLAADLWQKGLQRRVAQDYLPPEQTWQRHKIDFSDIIRHDLPLLAGLHNPAAWQLVQKDILARDWLASALTECQRQQALTLSLGRLAIMERFARRYQIA